MRFLLRWISPLRWSRTSRSAAWLGAAMFSIGLSVSPGPAHGAEVDAGNNQDGQSITAEQRDFFENRIRPIFAETCQVCHSSDVDEPKGNLRLDSRAGWMQGGDRGPVIVPAQPDQSLLIEAVRYANTDLQMPPDGKLAEDDIASLVKWIEMGAPDPRSPVAKAAAQPAFDLQQRRAQHWAWQPVREVAPPPVADVKWPSHDLDRFVLAKLEHADLSPAPPADRLTWIRRVTFDLIGLPPQQDEIDTFLADNSRAAYEHVVDRLLRSAHYGEHWGQHWLDLVRYAETRGHEQDYVIPEAYRFRDYVIYALNEDVPYDQFVVEHIAGDLVPSPRRHSQDRTNQSMQGTGFWHLHEQTHSPVDIRGDEADRMHNQIDVFSRAFLGLSVGCARCHDHKFDAISTRDYYSMFGYLQSSSYRLTDVSDPILQRDLFEQLTNLNRQYSSDLVEQFTAMRAAQLASFPDYLLASAALIQAGEPLDASQEKPKDGEAPAARASENVAKLATDRKLDTALLWHLVRHVKSSAADNVRDPLHLIARVLSDDSPFAEALPRAQTEARESLNQSRAKLAERRTNLRVIKSIKDGERNYKPVSRDWDEIDIIEDFDFAGDVAGRWITDGFRFGFGPGQPGEVLFGENVTRPLKRFLDAAAAEVVSNRFTGFVRTRTFEVTGDRLWYRFRGKADVFLAVDSHRVVNGPLHAVVRQQLKGSNDQWQWFAHNVRDYIGHRVHVEFSPQDGFAVERILFAAEEPPIDEPFSAVARQLASSEDVGESLEAIAQYTTAALIEAMRVETRDIPTMNWLLHHDVLFASDESRQAFAETAEAYFAKRNAIEGQIPSPVHALALLDGDGEDEPVHIRGNHRNLSAEKVPRRVLTALRDDDVSGPQQGSGRLHLARELVNRDNPLVSRVFVNRVWHHLFGRGLVETVDDFGVMGKPPSHPELLDYLAVQFVDNGWSIKQILRDVVLSSSYRMSSYPIPASNEVDSANLLFHRMPVRRLPAESIRDHILTVSGRLDRRMFGKSTMVHITPFMRSNRSPKDSGPLDGDGRRSIYTEVRRNHLSAMLIAFDKPAPFMAIGKRSVSNSPAQSLILLNDPFVHQQAEIWAKHLLAILSDDTERVQHAYVTAFTRQPSDVERSAALEFLKLQRRAYLTTIVESTDENTDEQVDRDAWSDLCHTLMNVKEFIHIN